MSPELTWLLNYSGQFAFYLDLKRQVKSGRLLSDKQREAIKRAMEREKNPIVSKPFTIKPGAILIVGKFIAQRVAEENGLTRPHHAFEVMEVHRETEKAYNVTAKCTAQRTSYCGVCGLKLTNPESVTNGIGPICAEKHGISYGGRSLEELAERLQLEKPVTAWIAKKSIKNLEEICAPNAQP
jgi:hypothetical protein